MQNDVLKNETAPWQEKGRWYHAKINLVNASYITDQTDAGIMNDFNCYTDSSGIFLFTKPGVSKQIIDCHCKYNNLTRSGYSTTGGYGSAKQLTPDGRQLLLIAPPTNSTGTCDVWCFIV